MPQPRVSTVAAPGATGVRVLGVRHHGPGSARSVVRALDQLQPVAVLVELPADTQGVLPWMADRELVPPVAILGYLAHDVSAAAFLPLAEFSPEWQAVRWALDHGVAPVAIDAPLGWSLSGTLDADLPVELRTDAGHDDADGDVPTAPMADPLGALAAAAGEPDAERWWDDVVEHRGDGVPAFDAVADAMDAVRSGITTPADDLRREAHMRIAIRAAQAAYPDGLIAVVCGAWHVPALDVAGTTARADATLLKGARKGAAKAAVTWVPWSDQRLRRQSGYGAGVAAPGWYRHVFAHPGPDGVARFFVDAAGAMRTAGLVASPDHLIGASRLADALAGLRNRPRAGLAEVLDAAGAVMGGDSGRLPPVIDELTVGDRIGAVPSGAPQVPLVRDVTAAQRSARLGPTGERRVVELDLRTPNGRRRSHLLHRLDVLGAGWGSQEEGRGTRGTFRETWALEWSPSVTLRLVERASFGVTLVDAATAYVVDRAGSATTLAAAATLVDQALLAELPDAVDACARALGARAARAPDVADLIDAVVPLANAVRYGDVRGLDSASLRTVLDELVVRIVAGLDGAVRRLADDAATAMVERLSGLQGALAIVDHPARHRDLPEALARIADARGGHGLVRGRATRLLHDEGTWSAAEVSQRVGRALTPGTPPGDGARFVEGFLAGSGTVLVHDRTLLGVIDSWVAAMPPDTFADAVALLRRTFGAFEPAERRQLGLLVAARPQPDGAIVSAELDPDRVRAGMATVRAMLGLAPVADP